LHLIPVLLFIGLPIVEIMLFIEIGGRIGALETVALCGLTAFIGVMVARAQGSFAVRRLASRVRSGQVPPGRVLNALFIALAAMLLVVPGFLTDAFGALLLVPLIRWPLARMFAQRLTARRFHASEPEPRTRAREPDVEFLPPGEAPRPPKPPAPPKVIDVD